MFLAFTKGHLFLGVLFCLCSLPVAASPLFSQPLSLEELKGLTGSSQAHEGASGILGLKQIKQNVSSGLEFIREKFWICSGTCADLTAIEEKYQSLLAEKDFYYLQREISASHDAEVAGGMAVIEYLSGGDLDNGIHENCTGQFVLWRSCVRPDPDLDFITYAGDIVDNLYACNDKYNDYLSCRDEVELELLKDSYENRYQITRGTSSVRGLLFQLQQKPCGENHSMKNT